MMQKYALLANPGHNRIYADTAFSIAYSELNAILKSIDIDLSENENNTGLPNFICFSTKKRLENSELEAIGFSSVFYVLFEIEENDLLKPVLVPDFHKFPESMVQILKYNGKTNEQFTRLMVNLAVSSCKTGSKKLTLFDPMCGKGTTMYEGFIRGFDVKGIEINKKYFQEIQTFVIRFLKDGKFKHKIMKSNLKDSRHRKVAEGFNLYSASLKEDFNSGNTQLFQLFNSDTKNSNTLIKKKSCDMIVCDLPYGVQHASKNDKNVNISRSPIGILKSAIPSWKSTLKTNGSIVLSFNEFTLSYREVANVLKENGFKVLEESPYSGYQHRVDQAINRNLIVAFLP